MEMDIPMIYVEMGILSVIITIYCMLKLVRGNWYNFTIIAFCLLELLTSHWFDIVYFWILAYITLGSVSYEENDSKKGKKGIRIVVRHRKCGGSRLYGGTS
jgi:hypothetical protein